MRADIPGGGSIEFEGHPLPDSAKDFETLPFFKDLPTEVQQWVLDLRYAWGRERSASSELILKACDLLENGIYTHKEAIQDLLAKRASDMAPSEICQEWLLAIMTMRNCAERQPSCSWTMQPLPGEVRHFLTATIRIFKSMIATQNARLPKDKQHAPPPILEVIGSRPEVEQIAFINAVMDGMSGNKTPSV